MDDNGRENVYPFEKGLSPVTAKLVDLLKAGKPDDVLTDEEMTEHCGRSTKVHGSGYGNLNTAIRRVERLHGLVWRRVPTAGCIRCLTDDGKASVVSSGIGSIHRKSRRTTRVGALTDISKMSEEKRNEFLVNMAVIGATKLMTKTATGKKLLARGITKAPDISKMLEAFKEMK